MTISQRMDTAIRFIAKGCIGTKDERHREASGLADEVMHREAEALLKRIAERKGKAA